MFFFYYLFAFAVNAFDALHLDGIQRRKFYATTLDGFEKILSEEISCLPYVSAVRVGRCGVNFEGSVHTGLASLMKLRTSLKILENIGECEDIYSSEDLYKFVRNQIDWTVMIDSSHTMKCDVTFGQNTNNQLSHSHFTALTVKNAIVDQLRSVHDASRPSINLLDPDLSILLYLHRNKGILYRSWSGEESMHKRGYRQAIHKASLRETTAAGL